MCVAHFEFDFVERALHVQSGSSRSAGPSYLHLKLLFNDTILLNTGRPSSESL